jgi:hypothetical protein
MHIMNHFGTKNGEVNNDSRRPLLTLGDSLFCFFALMAKRKVDSLFSYGTLASSPVNIV